MIHLQVNNDYYKQFDLATAEDLDNLKCELHSIQHELDCRLREAESIETTRISTSGTSFETPHLYVDVANINTLINPQLRQLEFEISKLKDKVLAIENKRQEESKKDIVYIMGE